MRRLVQFQKVDDFIFPLIENICKPRKLAHEAVSSLFVAKCERCKGVLDGASMAIEAAAVMRGHVPKGCPHCGHGRFVAEVSGLSTSEEERLRNDEFFATLATPAGSG